jgi:hypothetical protein
VVDTNIGGMVLLPLPDVTFPWCYGYDCAGHLEVVIFSNLTDGVGLPVWSTPQCIQHYRVGFTYFGWLPSAVNEVYMAHLQVLANAYGIIFLFGF